MEGVTNSFDLATYQRDKIRRLEQRVAGLEDYRDQLARVLAAVLQAMFDDTHVDPFEYLQAVVDIDQATHDPLAYLGLT